MSRSCRLTLVRLATNAATAATYPGWRVFKPEVRRPDRDRGRHRRPRRPRASGGDTMNGAAPKKYLEKAINNEAAIVAKAEASTRNAILNRSAFKLGTIPGAQLDTVVGALLPAACANGYMAEHGESATRKSKAAFKTVSADNEKFPDQIRQNVAPWRFKASAQLTSACRRLRSRHYLTSTQRGQSFHPVRSLKRLESLTSLRPATKARQRGTARSAVTYS
jgi:hypothetical protein